MTLLFRILLMAVALGLVTQIAAAWERDFARQPVPKRPKLEVRYTGAGREAFEIVAETYRLTGQLRAPHHLVAQDGALWLGLSVTAEDGTEYATAHVSAESRINLYRRGPYYCEVRWLDVRVATEAGQPAPLKGDLALYCYPDKLLASLTWHATDEFGAATLRIDGVAPATRDMGPLSEGAVHTLNFPLFGEETPGGVAFETLEAVRPMAYDGARGCFTIGSLGDGGFQGRFYDTPNLYDTVRFRIANETDEARTVYVCHENIGGDKGCVEGGVLLDEDGHPLPIVVQISKNFAGEKEEPFYNPQDTPFSELYYPLMLAPGESREITSLQLYQNWGSHMVKQFSSLGAWMDYFHSSTGVTETTCYVPFKFGGLPGVAIADFRAMSQPYFWSGQPQHDNVAGHSFLSYDAGEGWRYLVYQGTNYHSTGPNWMHIGFDYLSADGALKAHVESVELPQVDELRQCVRVRYEALKPVTLSEAGGNLRLLTCASWVQRMRYNHMAATGMAPQRLTFDEDGYAVLGHPLPHENSFAAVYGEPKGSNAFVLRRWETSVSDLGPAVSLWRETSGDTRLLLTVDKDEVTLQPGDFVEFDAVIMPYGVITNADIPERETVAYGSEGPKVVSVARGRKLRDFPAIIEAEEDAAEFTIQGGRDALPVVVTGLSDYRDPRLERKTAAGWQLVSHYRVSPYDGAQTFVCEDGGFGAVFLVNSNAAPQTLRARLGGGAPKPELVQLDAFEPSEAAGDFKKLHHAALIQAPWMDAPIHLRYPETVNTDALDFIDHEREDMPPRVDPGPLATQWKRGEGGSLWFEWNYDNQAMGGRLSPGTDFVDLEFWIENRRPETVPLGLQFCPVLEGTAFDDPQLERTFGYVDGEWVALMNTDRSEGAFEMCHYEVGDAELPPLPKPWGRAAEKLDEGFVAIKSEDGKRIFAIVWPQARNVLTNTHIPCVHADPPPYPAAPGKRLHLRGKVYLIEGSLDDLLARVRREVTPMAKRFD